MPDTTHSHLHLHKQPKITKAITKKKQVKFKIKMKGIPKQFNAKKYLNTLSSIMKVNVKRLKIISIKSGSIIVETILLDKELPIETTNKKAIQLLIDAFKKKDKKIKTLLVDTIEVESHPHIHMHKQQPITDISDISDISDIF